MECFCMLNKLNRMDESKHRWRTPTVVSKNSLGWLFKRTALPEFSHSAWMSWASPSSMFKLLWTSHRPARQTLPNAFFKSMKLWNRSRWCCRCFSMMTRLLNNCSTVLRPGVKPTFSCSSSALALSRLSITRRMILLGWLIALLVWLFSHCLRLHFCEKGTANDCVYSFRHFLVSQIWHITVSPVVASRPFLSSSETMLSTLGDFIACRLCTTSTTSVAFHEMSLPTPIYFVLTSSSVFMALSTIFHSINSPDNSPLSHSVLPVLILPYWSFQLYISLWKSPSAQI